MEARTQQIVTLVREHPGTSADALARGLDISTRTLRTGIARANESLAPFAHIGLKRGEGYFLHIDDEDAFRRWESAFSARDDIGESAEDRCRYLLNDLLWREDWITLDDLADVLYVSRSTVARDMRLVEERLAAHDLAVERRPYRGIRVVGDEVAKRRLLASLAVGTVIPTAGEEQVAQVSAVVEAVLAEDGIAIPSVSYQNMIVHIVIALRRIDAGNRAAMVPDQLDDIRAMPEYATAEKIVQGIACELKIRFPEEEIAYIAIHLAGRHAPSPASSGDSTVIPEEVWSLVERMVDAVSDEFHFDFRGDLELKMNLAQHVTPLMVRLRYSLAMQNPMLADIQTRFPLAFSMARYSSQAIAVELGAPLPDEEVGYLALSFALALERRQTDLPRKSILVVCASGRGSARLLEHRYRAQFGEYLEHVYTCDVQAVSGWDFSTIDYVMTTVPLSVEPPVPTLHVGFFLEPDEVEQIRHALEREPSQSIEGYFSPELLCPHLTCHDKWEVLSALCDRVVRLGAANADLERRVVERERLFPTSFGNLVAVPHAAEPSGLRTMVCVGLLDTPVIWDDDGHGVRLVLLVSFSAEGKSGMADLFSVLADRLLSEQAVSRLLEDQTWETLHALLAQDR